MVYTSKLKSLYIHAFQLYGKCQCWWISESPRAHVAKRKRKKIRLSPMTKSPTPTEKSKKQRDNTQHATKNFVYTTIAGRITTDTWVTTVIPLVWLNRFTSAQPSL